MVYYFSVNLQTFNLCSLIYIHSLRAGLRIRINQVTMSSELQAPLGPGADSPATAIPKQKRIRKSGSGSYKETARRILDPVFIIVLFLNP